MQREYACQKKNLNAKLIKLTYLCHGAVIHHKSTLVRAVTLVSLWSSNVITKLTKIEMKRQMTKRKLSGINASHELNLFK